MLQVPRSHSTSKAADGSPAAEVCAYVDTTEIWFPRHAAKQEIARYGRVEECRKWNGELVGYRLIRNQPS